MPEVEGCCCWNWFVVPVEILAEVDVVLPGT